MKYVGSVLIFLTLCSAVAFGGDRGSGGGSDVVAEFVLRATALLTRLGVSNPNTPEIKVLKDLIAGPNLKILPVDTLKDIVTGQPIPDQNGLIAYGQPGTIQLRTQVWDQAFRSEKNMDHHIFHELCRAAAPACNDEAYRVSIVQLHLAPSSYVVQAPPTSTPEQIMKLAIEQSDESGIKQALQLGLKLEAPIRTVGGTSFSSSEYLTPLAYAAEIGNDRSIEILLGLGAKVDYVDSFNESALHRAAAFNHSSSIRFLFSKGASLEPNPSFYYNEMIPVGDANIPTPLMTTIYTGAIEAAQTLLELGAKTDYSWPADLIGRESIDSPLGEAVGKEKVPFVKLLISYHANVNRPFWGCWAPLLCAANTGNLEVANLLISAGADVNEVISDEDPHDGKIMGQNTPLMVAKTKSMAQLLVRRGANPKFVSTNGDTALTSQAYEGSLDLIKYLVSVGCPLNTIEDDLVGDGPKTALDYAIQGKNTTVELYLRSIGAKKASEIQSSK